jgi:hypothetical protein
MTTRPRPTPHDVARLMNGEMYKPDEIDWLMDWHERDAAVRHWFEMLDVESALGVPPEDTAPELSPEELKAARRFCRDLASSRADVISLCSEHHAQLLSGKRVEADLITADDWSARADARQIVPCTIAADAEDGVYRLTCSQLPQNMRPFNLTLARLDLAGNEPLADATGKIKIEWSATQINAHLANRPVAGDGAVRPAQKSDDVRRAAYGAGKLRVNDGSSLSLSADDGAPTAGFDMELIRGPEHTKDTLRVRCPVRTGRNLELAVVECQFPTYDGAVLTWRKPLLLSEHKQIAGEDLLVAEQLIPLLPPVDLGRIAGDRGLTDVKVRPAGENDLPLLDSRTLSRLLSEHQLTVFPLIRHDDGFRFRIGDEDRAAVNDTTSTWLLRWAPVEQEVGQ